MKHITLQEIGLRSWQYSYHLVPAKLGYDVARKDLREALAALFERSE